MGRALTELVATKPSQKLIATARKLETLSYLPDNNTNILKLALDVSTPTSVDNAFQAIARHFGPNHPIDVLVNNAGYSLAGDTEGVTEEQMHEVFETNFFGTVRVTTRALRIMRENNAGQGALIFNISSVVGACTFPGHAFYSSSKHAVSGWTECVVKEMHPDWKINFCLVEPGSVKTNFETTSKQHIRSVDAYAGDDMPARIMDKMVAKNRKAGSGVEPSRIAHVLYQVASASDRIPLHLPLTEITTYMMTLTFKARVEEIERLREFSAIDRNGGQWQMGTA